jgi:hypothetical protein
LKGIPNSVEKVLNEYISLFNELLPETIKGLYIHGSLALNAYVEDSSDIDFITITKRRLNEDDSGALSSIHTTIANKYEKPEMDGVYILREDLGKLYIKSNDFNYKYPYFNSGNVNFGDYFNFNPITWWLFKTKGINILGPEPNDYQIDIHPNQLFSYVLENMNTYWKFRIESMENSIQDLIISPTDKIDFEIEWTVLGLLRQFFTLKEYDIVSKMDSGEYGLLNVPEEWHIIIKEAIHIRKGVKSKAFNSDEERINATIAFSKYLINFCNSRLLFPKLKEIL